MGLALIAGCGSYRDDLDYSYNVQQTWTLDIDGSEQLFHGREIVQFESVFWEPDDTVSLRKLIVEDSIVTNRKVLEIGTGTGLIGILCLDNEASSVVATDINPAAVANAKYNAAMLVPDHKLDVRRVPTTSPSAFSVIRPTEKFDLVISNPPWEDGVVAKPADHAFYDPGFALMDSLLDGLPNHLNPGGRCLLAYGHVPAIRRLRAECERRKYGFKLLDDRDLETLPTDFLPGMLIEIRPPLNPVIVKGGTFQPQDSETGDSQDDDAASTAADSSGEGDDGSRR